MATDEHAVEVFTDKFSAIIPGKAKGFKLSELEAAKAMDCSGRLNTFRILL